MLYLKSLSLHRFKSFRNAELLFSKGFTCVVGPNGSGKSNICDALLFGLGEGSLRRLRARTLDSLITSSGGKQKGLRKAHVVIELGGDQDLSIIRGVRSDGKSMYRVNGKHMSRGEVVDMMARHGIHADETNTITQGEINRFNDLSPKGRRELIDIASGIEEFERKKDESIKELEKVSQRISEARMILDERLGFLSELEQEKESAEKYMELNSRLRALNFSVLSARKADAENGLQAQSDAVEKAESEIKALSERFSALTKKAEELTGERQQRTKDLSESTRAMGEINAKLEAVKMDTARVEAEIHNMRELASGWNREAGQMQEEVRQIGESIAKDLEQSLHLSDEIKRISKEIPEGRAMPKAIDEGQDLDALNAGVEEIEHKLSVISEKSLRIREEVAGIISEGDSASARLSELEDMEAGLSLKREGVADSVKKLSGEIARLEAVVRETESGISSREKEVSELEEKIIELRSQRASMQTRGSASYDKLKARFGKTKGFYGKASELCTYDSENAAAIEAAGGARLDYIIVDSIDTANKVILFLRENSLGRSTFIPLAELATMPETRKEKDAEPIVGKVEFGNEYRRAFEFIFGNTYLVADSASAKRIGIGKHRYVTREGDLVEQSGVLSGGSVQKRVSQNAIDMQIKEAADKAAALKGSLSSMTEGLFKLRKELAYADAERKSHSGELSTLEAEISKMKSEKAGLEGKASATSGRHAALSKELGSLLSEKESAEHALENARAELKKAYEHTMDVSRQIAEYGMSREELQRIEATRNEMESLKIRNAEIQKEKQMLEKRKIELEAQIKEKLKAAEDASKRALELERSVKKNAAAKAEIEKKITSDSEESKKAYGRISYLDQEISKISIEANRTAGDRSVLERKVAELRLIRGQAETRIKDLAAELAAYEGRAERLAESIESMEKEVIVINSKLSELGNVNMKAPEMYAEKKKSADDAVTRVKTLESERLAVMKMIEEIDSKKLQTFMSTLNEVVKNFSRLYNYIFEGSASIRLENTKDPFNSGLEVMVSEGKATKQLGSMSGGEKSLISLVLVFAIHMCKPSSLYIFDEVDAALDKENSRKLSMLIKEMSKNAQFIVVSHNDSLISNADTAIGVVKNESESKAIGIEVSSMLNKKQ